MQRLIQPGNAKLHNMYMFNLPASQQVCGRKCPGCYAIREQQRFPTILAARERRLAASDHPAFTTRIINELSKLRTLPPYFRIHASGEFYSQSYIDSWQVIVESFPSIVFYAYTKRLREFDFSKLASLPNFILINSLHFGKLNYGRLEEAPSGAFICPSHVGATCGQSCTYCMSKQAQTHGVWFKQH